MIEKLRKMNKQLMKINFNNEQNLKKYNLIAKILEDDKCFFKINIEYAYAILRDLGIEENSIKDVYMELIDIKNME